jgi:cytochrome d ubiquinol oxidase subunit I
MFPPGWTHEVVHVLVSCYQATGFAVAGIHAVFLLRHPASAFHRAALAIALGVGGLAAVVQPISGDLSARQVAEHQPLKLAAVEGHFRTERGAPLSIGGIPDVEARTMRWAIRIPNGLSLLAFHDPDAEVKGLEAFPRETWPDPVKVHLSFQAMVGLGSIMVAIAVWGALLRLRRRPLSRPFLGAVVAAGPMGFLALEAGWLVTEWGRQPFAIRDVMRVADAVTPVSSLAVPLVVFVLLYVFLGVMVAVLLWRQIAHAPAAPSPTSASPPARGGVAPEEAP